MSSRLVLRLPWYLSASMFVAITVVSAVLFHQYAGVYFERSFADDADPLAGAIAVPEPSTATSAGVPAGSAPAPAAQFTPVTNVETAAARATPNQSTAPAPSATSHIPAQPQTAAATDLKPGVLKRGQVMDGDPAHVGRGQARLIRDTDGDLVLRFENLSVLKGPDVFVYLTTDPNRGRGSLRDDAALNLGKLKATDGNVNYEVPDGIDPARYHSVIIWCRQFNVIMAWAPLEAAS